MRIMIAGVVLFLMAACLCAPVMAEHFTVVGDKLKVSFEAENVTKTVPTNYVKNGGQMDTLAIEFFDGVKGGVEVEYNPSSTRAVVNLTEECLSQIAQKLNVSVAEVPSETRHIRGQNITAGRVAPNRWGAEFRPPNHSDNIITVIADSQNIWPIIESMTFEQR